MSTHPSALQHRLESIGEALTQLSSLDWGNSDLTELLSSEAIEARSPLRSTPWAHGMSSARPFLEGLRSRADSLPAAEDGVSRPASSANLGLVGSKNIGRLFQGAINLHVFDPENFERVLDRNQLDLLVIAPDGEEILSAWRGLTVAGSRAHRVLIDEIIPRCRAQDTPIIYWGVDDPLTFGQFPELARLADHILTASEECLPLYSARCPEARSIDVLRAGVNPLIHSPIGSRSARGNAVLFDGPWPSRWREDREYLQWALDGVLLSDRPLVIVPREQESESQGLAYPRSYSSNVVSPVASWRVDDLMRATDIAVAGNAVVASQTSFSRRILELMASGTMVISTYNQGLNSHYPQVHIANYPEDVARLIDSTTLHEWRIIQSDGLRKVFLEEHVANCIDKFLATVGIGTDRPREVVLGVASTRDSHLVRQMAQQTHSHVELATWDDLSTMYGTYDILIPLSEERGYSPTYVADHVAAFSYQNRIVTTKLEGESAVSDGGSHSVQLQIDNLDLTAWWRPDGAATQSPETLRGAVDHQGVYAIDNLGYHARRGPIVTGRKQPLGKMGRNSPIRERAPRVCEEDDFTAVQGDVSDIVKSQNLQLSVIVPIYNNGEHLRHKCFASLRRSSIFSKMHVLLVDDGSIDSSTIETVEDLAHEYPNVTAFHHAPGGSGSASRPRNTGLALAQTPYVTYLDPDNEATEDGFARILVDLEKYPDVDFGIGNISVWRDRFRGQRYFQRLQEAFSDVIDEEGTLHVPPKAIAKVGFRPISIQAAVIRTAWLKALDLKQPLGAVGQDTFFFQQMFHYARRIRTYRFHVHTYYSAVANSTVNSVSPKFYKKYAPLEKARSDWLREVGLLEEYRSRRLERFLRSWHLNKLNLVHEEDWLEAAETIAEFTAYYGPMNWKSAKVRQFYSDLASRRAKRRGSESSDQQGPAE